MTNLITVNSYFDLFPTLVDKLGDMGLGNKKNLIFCEAKISLMVERYICALHGGSFNTEVYSFGKYLSAKKKIENLLSKEGSSMAVKRILTYTPLKRFNKSRTSLASTMYDLIIQLKSAKISPSDIARATENVDGVLKNKLIDIYSIYSEYENYVKENGYEDQSSYLSFLPKIIENSNEIKETDVFLVGYSGFTAQMRSVISALVENAKSVTAILVEGDNEHVFVNETAQFIREICAIRKKGLTTKKVDSTYSKEGRIIVDNLFAITQSTKNEKLKTDKVHVLSARNPAEEIQRVGSVIKRLTIEKGCRFKDISVALPDINVYSDEIESTFKNLDIPYFLDEQKVSDSHPLVTLILSYVNAYRKGLERKEICAFFKNPLFLQDKTLTDALENYLIKYNINYAGIHRPFTFPAVTGATLEQLETLRQKISVLFNHFDVRKTLLALDVENALSQLAESLKVAGEYEQASVTEQVYDAVNGLLDQMDMMLGGVDLSLTEFKEVFSSGVSALKLSIIPQYNDAVFIGGFKETSLAKAKYLFAVGLDSSVPAVQSDVALLSDEDIDALETVKVLVEPKIRVVNHRARENLGMALSAFSEGLFLSYSIANANGDKKVKSQIFSTIEKSFTLKPFPEYDGYITYAQAFNSFAKACGEFAEGKTVNGKDYDFTLPSSFYKTVDCKKLQPLLDVANKEVKVRLDGNRSLIGKVISPTTIEDYYKCPYRAFLAHSLKIKDRENGEVGVLSVGNIMHEILSEYVKNIKLVTSREDSDNLFERVKDKILERDEYKKFLQDGGTNATVKRVMRECKEYAFKTYQSLRNSSFTNSKAEVSFSDMPNSEYPAIPLNGGKVKIKGKIDRVDLSDKYYRVIDYKTGRADPSEKALFAGVKLQLYLYAQAVKNKYKDQEMFPAGLYYLPVSDKYDKPEDKGGALAVGQTLNDKQALEVQDKEFFERGESDFAPVKIDPKKGEIKNAVDKETLLAYMDYAVKVSESAVDNLENGVMIASPYKGACEYCEYGGLCGMQAKERTVDSVDKSSFDLDKLGEIDE